MMHALSGVKLAAALLLVASSATANEARTFIPDGAPKEIVSFSSTYNPESFDRYAPREGVTHKLELRNTSGKPVVAYGVGLHLFDVFDEAMGRGLNGIAIEPVADGATVLSEWSDSPLAAFKFQKYGTSVAYIRQVRFEDGTVWKADLSQVLDELRKIEGSLTMDAIDPGLPE